VLAVGVLVAEQLSRWSRRRHPDRLPEPVDSPNA
jgi:hypothetical protein